ncbi:MAG: alpha/beta hydrolase [Rubrivivax sp.]|nr:alpha/beta hydrolase [Rubrivivax sp.]
MPRPSRLPWPLPPPLPLNAEAVRLGDVVCHVAGQGPPLLLVHSVNAAASAHEVRPLLNHWRQTHTVFAPDLPGFGSSVRRQQRYTPRLMTDALHAVSALVQQRCAGAPMGALAVSLGCEFLARAAAERPADYRRLALVSPTGLNGTAARRGAPGSTRAVPGLHAVLTAPLWRRPLFRALTRPGVVRDFLERPWGRKAIDETMWADAVRAAQAPGAEHAPLSFLSAGLFSADVLSLYEALTQPVWASHGVRGDFTDYRGQVHLSSRPNWRFTVFDSGALPYFEHPADFNRQLQQFLHTDDAITAATAATAASAAAVGSSGA